MKKVLSTGVLGIFLLGLVFSTGFSQDANSIIAKMLDAQGGRKLLESIKDTTARADMEMPEMGMTATGIMYTKEPNKMRLDLEIMGMMISQGTDGETAWTVNPETGITEELPAELAEISVESAYGNSAFLNPEKYDIRYEYKGKETIDGRECLVLDRIMPSDYIISFYIDAGTYLLYKTKQQSYNEMLMEIVEEAVMSDYKKVDGVMTAHSVIIVRDGVEFAIMTITEMSFNTGLEDSFFEMGK
jgi:outer membrane lipoprotein-sorting protein